MTRTQLSLFALCALPLLLAVKCFDPPEDPLDGDAGVDAMTGGDASAGEGGPLFTPAVSCPQAGTARLSIVDFSYQVQCGCREASGKTCTIPRGTRVIWQFADSEEHNVASDGVGFGASGERLTGTYSHSFEVPGHFGYGCTIHTEMSGYAIVVE